jgi:hypothetical protein
LFDVLLDGLAEGSTVYSREDIASDETEWSRFIAGLKNCSSKIHKKQLLSEEEQAGQPWGAAHRLINCFASNLHSIFSYCAQNAVAACEKIKPLRGNWKNKVEKEGEIR